jgi:hypothetical protein
VSTFAAGRPSGGTFVNEPLLELRRAPVREVLVDALAALDRELPWHVPVLIGGERRDHPSFESSDPGAPEAGADGKRERLIAAHRGREERRKRRPYRGENERGARDTHRDRCRHPRSSAAPIAHRPTT